MWWRCESGTELNTEDTELGGVWAERRIWGLHLQLCCRNEMLKLWKGSAVPSEAAGTPAGELCMAGRTRIPAGTKAQVNTAKLKPALAEGSSVKPGFSRGSQPGVSGQGWGEVTLPKSACSVQSRFDFPIPTPV